MCRCHSVSPSHTTVDVLGVAVEVRADHGGIVAKLRCASGDPVEYGQELFLLESVGEGKL